MRLYHFRPAGALHLRLLACASALTLLAALIAQFVFHLPPCHLCLLQRWPYIVIIFVGIWGGWFTRKLRVLSWLQGTVILALLVGFGIAAYHTGVHWGWFPGPSSCSSSGGVEDSLEAMRAAIMAAPIIACDQPIGDIFNVSLAAWSALIYAFLTISAVLGYYRHRRLDV